MNEVQDPKELSTLEVKPSKTDEITVACDEDLETDSEFNDIIRNLKDVLKLLQTSKEKVKLKQIRTYLRLLNKPQTEILIYMKSLEKNRFSRILKYVRDILQKLFTFEDYHNDHAFLYICPRIVKLLSLCIKIDTVKASKYTLNSLKTLSSLLLLRNSKQIETLQDDTCKVLEFAWLNEFKNREEYSKPMIEYLVSISFNNSTLAVLKRLLKVMKAFECFDFESESSLTLRKDILKTYTSSNYLSNISGINLLAKHFILSPYLTLDIFSFLKSEIIFYSKPLLLKLSSVLYKAWSLAGDKSSTEETQNEEQQKEVLTHYEDNVIKKIVEYCIYLKEEKVREKYLFILTESFFKQKQNDKVEFFLLSVFESVLYSSLNSANPIIRTNSLQFLSLCFPIRNPEAGSALEESQFEILGELLFDEYDCVRKEAIKTTTRVLSVYWEIIPKAHLKSLTSNVFTLSFDESSSKVRSESVLCFVELLKVPFAREVCKKIIFKEEFKDLLFDKSLQVKKSYLKLLIYVQKNTTIPIEKIMGLEDMVRVLETETKQVLIRSVVEILQPIYYPLKTESGEQFKRIAHLITKSKDAAFKFFTYLHHFVEDNVIIKLIRALSLWIKTQFQEKNKVTSNQQNAFVCNFYIALNTLWKNSESSIIQNKQYLKLLEGDINYSNFIKPSLKYIFSTKQHMSEEHKESIKTVVLEIAARYPEEQRLKTKILHNLVHYNLDIEEIDFVTKKESVTKCDFIKIFSELSFYLGAEVKCLIAWKHSKLVLNKCIETLNTVKYRPDKKRKKDKNESESERFHLVLVLWIINFIIQSESIISIRFLNEVKLVEEVLKSLFSLIEEPKEVRNMNFIALVVEIILKLETCCKLNSLTQKKKDKENFIEQAKTREFKFSLIYFDKIVALLKEKYISAEIRNILDILLCFESDINKLNNEKSSNIATSFNCILDKVDENSVTKLLSIRNEVSAR